MTKQCSSCGLVGPPAAFYKDEKARDGLYPNCKECHKRAVKRWKKTHREQEKTYRKKQNRRRITRWKALVDKLKSRPCADCGETYPPYVMDFDHRRDKLCNVAVLVHANVTLKRLKAEIAKCDIVCANCHRERTHGAKRRT
jgi:hypothetical protein